MYHLRVVAGSRPSKALGAGNIFAILLAACVVLCSIAPCFSVTARGVQCPTAPVQEIKVPVLSSCGCIEGFVTRSPKPGERGFVQCRCAEKRAPLIKASVSSRVQFFMPVEAVDLQAIARLDPLVSACYVVADILPAPESGVFHPPTFH